jgi:xanthine dehydrogenase iron-sulfur cluster and FAD-binding subunit A
MDVTIQLTVNGQEKSITTDSRRSLLEVLREDLGVTGVKYGCGEAQCGACSVLIGGRRVLSCVTPVSTADRKRIVTIEGLTKGDVCNCRISTGLRAALSNADRCTQTRCSAGFASKYPREASKL